MAQLIYVVEDDDSIRMLLRAALETEGFAVREYPQAAQALSDMKQYRPALVIFDIMLDGMDGITALRLMRQNPEFRRIKAMMLTAKDTETDKVKGLDSGADDYMTKPFSPSELVARVKAHLARYERLVGAGQPENDVIEIRGLKIDKTARRVFIDGVEKQFTTKEFDLLTFLAEHPNHVYSKEELFREIWDMDSIGDIATVTVHIKKIREKIEYDTSKPQYIETIWGVGYRFKI